MPSFHHLFFLVLLGMLFAIPLYDSAQGPAAPAVDGESLVILTRPGLQQFSCASVGEIPQVECKAPAALYEGADGDAWADNTNWLQTTTPSNWYGVTFDGGHVMELGLWSNNLSGPIPPELGSLANLTRLYLYSNQLSGALPLSLMNLHLASFWFGNTALCEPRDAAFQAWLGTIGDL